MQFRKLQPALIAWVSVALGAQSVPTSLNYQGRLTDNSPQQNAVTAVVAMRFRIFDSASAGTLLWTSGESQTISVSVTGGVFSVQLGDCSGPLTPCPLPASVFQGATSDRWLEIVAGGETLAPRQKLATAGYAALSENSNAALTAASANNSAQLGGVAAANYQRALATAACPGGQAYTAIAADGSASCGGTALSPPVNLTFDPMTLTPVFKVVNSNTTGGNAGWFETQGATVGTALTASNAGNGAGLDASSFYGHAITATAGKDGLRASGGQHGVIGFLNSGASSGAGVQGQSEGANTYGIYGSTVNGTGIGASSSSGYAVWATTGGQAGVFATSSKSNGFGAWAIADTGSNAIGVYGQSAAGTGISGQGGYSGLVGNSTTGTGLRASSTSGAGALIQSGSGAGVIGLTDTGTAGIFMVNGAGSTSAALYASTSGTGPAGQFAGNVVISGKATSAATTGADPATTLATKGYVDAAAGVPNPLSLSGNSASPIIYGNNAGSGAGVSGYGGDYGVYASSEGQAVRGLHPSTGNVGYLGGAAVGAYGSGSVKGVSGVSSSGDGVSGNSVGGTGVYGYSTNGAGISGSSGTGKAGEFTISNAANTSAALTASTNGSGAGVSAYGGDYGVLGTSDGQAVRGVHSSTGNVGYLGGGAVGAYGSGTVRGVSGVSSTGDGTSGSSVSGNGVYGYSTNGTGISGSSGTGKAGEFVNSNNANGSPVLTVATNGSGAGARIDQNYASGVTYGLSAGVASPNGYGLHTEDNARVEGLTRGGSETGTTEAPSIATGIAYRGLVMRRVNSTVVTAGSVVARTEQLQLERDGTVGGLRINAPAALSYLSDILCIGLKSDGTNLNKVISLAQGSSGVTALYATTDNMVKIDCSFGTPYSNGQLTRVELARHPGDNFFAGTVTSTYNQ